MLHSFLSPKIPQILIFATLNLNVLLCMFFILILNKNDQNLVFYILITVFFLGLSLFLKYFKPNSIHFAPLFWAIALTIYQLNMEDQKDILQITVIS